MIRRRPFGSGCGVNRGAESEDYPGSEGSSFVDSVITASST